MPELPEVETYARALAPGLEGVRLTGAQLPWPKVAASPPAGAFARFITGRTIKRIWRRAKYLVFDLDKGAMVIHLRMTGKLAIEDSRTEVPRHMTLAIGLDDGRELRFIDYRKFGRVWLMDDPDEVLGKLGPEPLAPTFTARSLARRLEGRRGRLKPLLLDQRFIAGLGNIYVDEALHRARLHPLATADTLEWPMVKALYRSIRAVLREAIEQGGTTILNFAGPDGQPGRFRSRLRVFGRQGQICRRRGCPGVVRRIVVGQRSTHYCPVCQPAP